MRGGGARTEVQHQGQSGELVARSGQRIEPQDQGRQVLASGGDDWQTAGRNRDDAALGDQAADVDWSALDCNRIGQAVNSAMLFSRNHGDFETLFACIVMYDIQLGKPLVWRTSWGSSGFTQALPTPLRPRCAHWGRLPTHSSHEKGLYARALGGQHRLLQPMVARGKELVQVGFL